MVLLRFSAVLKVEHRIIILERCKFPWVCLVLLAIPFLLSTIPILLKLVLQIRNFLKPPSLSYYMIG
jgi:hypothetical protein